jgi:hypothetical protein
MARSETKLVLESPMIAAAIAHKLQDYVRENYLSPQRVLVLGVGSIGFQISNILEKNYILYRYDIEESRSDVGKERLEAILSTVDIIIGCTGESALLPQHYNLLKRPVVLVSASSSDIEFSAVYLRRQAPRTEDTHKNIVVDDVLLLNCGFPLNFDGSKQIIPIRDIQLTEALVLGAVCLAQQQKYSPGLVEYKEEVQHKIREYFHKLREAA